MGKITARIIALALALMSFQRAWGVENFLEFFGNRGLRVMTKPAVPPSYAQSIKREWYWMEDVHRNQFVLPLVPQSVAILSIQLHRCLEALGVSHFPFRPVFVKRGRNGIPLWQEGAEGLDPSIPNDAWTATLIIPAIDVERGPSIENMTVEQLTELLQIILTQYALRAQSSHWHWSHGHPLVYEMIQPFRWSTEKPIGELLEGYLSAFPVAKLQMMSALEARAFVDRMTPFFSRLESIGKHDLGLFFEMYFMFRKPPAGEAKLTPIQFARRVRGNFLGVRAEFQNFLRSRVGGAFAQIEFPKGQEETPFVSRSPVPFSNKTEVVPSLLEDRSNFNARTLLEQYFFAEPQFQAAVFTQWKNELAGKDPLEHLHGMASRWDATMRIVLPTRTFYGHGFDLPVATQFHLNRNLPRTLILFSQQDKEGDLIESVVREIGPVVRLTQLRLKMPRWGHLDETHVDRIVNEAVAKGIRRVIICELHGVADKYRYKFEQAGIQLILLDHHNGTRETWQPLSTAEQLMQMYGYEPSLEQQIIAARDRSGFSAYTQLGMTPELLEEYLDDQKVLRSLRNRGAVFPQRNSDGRDHVPLLDTSTGSYPSIGSAYSFRVFPHVPNVIVVNHQSAGFYGAGPVVLDLSEYFTENYGERDMVWEGDVNGSGFFTVRTRSNEDKNLLLFRIKEVVLANRSGALRNPCIGAMLTGDF